MAHEVGVACGTCALFSPLSARACAGCGAQLTIVLARRTGDGGAAEAREPTPEAGAFEGRDGSNLPTRSSEVPANALQAAPHIAQNVPSSRGPGEAEIRPPSVSSPADLTGAGTSGAGAEGPLSPQVAKENAMEQARHYVCKECSTPVPSGHKFCGRCGAVVPPQILDLRTDFFGAMQTPGKARLILIRGDAGGDGTSYHLQGTEHVAGRSDGQIRFPEDNWLSLRHANFLYRGDKLVVRDEGSLNGVYLRVRGQVPIEAGDSFLCGEQVFRLDRTPTDTSGPDADNTYFYTSPRRPSAFRIAQLLRGGGEGMVVCARDNQCTIGREDCDLNFPEDVFMTANHARIAAAPDGSFSLIDNNSKNGTYQRLRGERELSQGDYLFLGRQLLRVEITL